MTGRMRRVMQISGATAWSATMHPTAASWRCADAPVASLRNCEGSVVSTNSVAAMEPIRLTGDQARWVRLAFKVARACDKRGWERGFTRRPGVRIYGVGVVP